MDLLKWNSCAICLHAIKSSLYFITIQLWILILAVEINLLVWLSLSLKLNYTPPIVVNISMRLQIMTMESIIHQTKPFDLLIKSSRHYNKRLYMRKEKFVKMHTIIRGLKVHIQNCTVLFRLLMLQNNVFKALNTKYSGILILHFL